MESERIKFLIITTNVGSLFEEFGHKLQKNWIVEFHKLVTQKQPTFIALHLQEVGGKTLEVCKDGVRNFFDELHKPASFSDYCSVYSFIDEEYAENKYTALGCSYFIHKSLTHLTELWNFTENTFKSISESKVLYSISEDTDLIKKYKFPLSCFSKHVKRWPRKGFTWTRWKFNDKIFDMLNIHLTHDACNIKAALKSPTKYAKHRRRSFKYALERITELPANHQILFGDFNVRPDTKELVEHLMKNLASQHIVEDKDGKPTLLLYKSINGTTKDLLKIGGRFFELSNYEAFNHDRIEELIHFDNELNWVLEDSYKEMKITFQPTYPHKEDPDFQGDYTFAHVRCPSWCDRIIVDNDLYNEHMQNSSLCTYDSYGTDVHLGDHKPVYLAFDYPPG